MPKRLFAGFFNFYGFLNKTPGALVLFLELLFGVMSVLLCLYVFLEFADEVLEQEAFFFDSIIMQFVYSLRSPGMTEFMLFITALGGSFLVYLAVILIGIFLIKKHEREAILVTFILGMGIVLNYILKWFTQRPRPDLGPLVTENFYSFPSGHAMNSFIFYTTFSYFFYHFTGNKKWTFWVSFFSGLLIFLIGVSRIYLGVHYPSDVVAGYIAGFIWFVSVLLAEKTIIFFKLSHEARQATNKLRGSLKK